MIDYSKLIPTEYWNKPDKCGQLVKDSYNGKGLMAYIPYGFHRDNQYDIFYFKMGTNNKCEQFWNYPPYVSHFEYVVDNLIDRCIIKPCIIISIDGNPPNKGWLQTNALGMVKYVESKVRSYADRNVEPSNLIATRNHRAVGGWSLGAIECRTTLINGIGNDFYKMFGYWDIQSGYNATGMATIDPSVLVRCVCGSRDDGGCVVFTSQCLKFFNDIPKLRNDKAQIVSGYTHSIQYQIRYFYNALIEFMQKATNQS
jgi:hypothetical protein